MTEYMCRNNRKITDEALFEFAGFMFFGGHITADSKMLETSGLTLKLIEELKEHVPACPECKKEYKEQLKLYCGNEKIHNETKAEGKNQFYKP